MILITWNVQWCRGVDGRVDARRIVDEARRLADFDVLCLQEIADNFPDPRLAGHDGGDQFAQLAALLPDYTALTAPAVDHPDDAGGAGRRRRFGNMILSRLPVRQVFRYTLPFPVDPGVNGMPRIALEAVIGAAFGQVRVITTHLEYYSQAQRSAQVEALRTLYSEGHAHARQGSVTDVSGGPFHTFLRPAETLVCGDFNLEPDDPLHARMIAPFADGTPPLHDTWQALHATAPHPVTFKLYEKLEPGEPELHCDFVFVNAPLRARLRSIAVDATSKASDHQAVIVHFA